MSIALRAMSTIKKTVVKPSISSAVLTQTASPPAPAVPDFTASLNGNMMEELGPRLRRQRRRLGLTLEELAGRAGISKPYLSLIETGRVPNPPSDEKLRRLEQVLGFTPGELVSQAHVQRTPKDVRAMLGKLLQGKGELAGISDEATKRQSDEGKGEENGNPSSPSSLSRSVAPSLSSSTPSLPKNLDEAYLTGVLQELVDQSAGNVEQIASNVVPVINKVSAGYPKEFTDLSYPKGVADHYVGCPDLNDKDAFAARVHGDSMSPKYRQGDLVIFSPAASPKNGDDCFVRFEDGHTTFKRTFFEADEKGRPTIRLQPRNEKYRPQTVPAEQITGLWKAMYRYQRVDED